MNRVIRVSGGKYLITFLLVVIHVITISILSHIFLPQLHLTTVIILAGIFYIYKVIGYLSVSIHRKDSGISYNGILKKNIEIPYLSMKEMELEGPSQFNSNYTMAIYGESESQMGKKKLVRIPIYWFRRSDVRELLVDIRKKRQDVFYQQRLSQYIKGEDRKHLFINYLIQYILLGIIIVFIIRSNN
jgi:hypothetical protein